MSKEIKKKTGNSEQKFAVGVAVRSLAGQLEAAFGSVGASLMSADFAAKLLAYLYAMGGGNEAVTLNGPLNAGIRIAQEKFKLKSGEAPDSEGVILLKKYVAELESSFDPEQGYQAQWLDEIEERYNLKIRKKNEPHRKAS